ncbi:hypothetical protein ACEYW6_11530 [Nostoc sp. UIC 10607]|uniref:hypothetical protein n=1 Tax=Nostoc sp. UIC 10607 TaxID=3045935 RepID=UPI0039A35695
MQITKATTGAGLPHGIGHSNSWKYFSTSNSSGTINREKYVYYSVSSKYASFSFEERRTKALQEQQKLKKYKKLIKVVKIANCK